MWTSSCARTGWSNIPRLTLGVALLSASLAATTAHAATTFTVDSVGDGAAVGLTSDGTCDAGAGVCTLRAAIEEANGTAGTDTIEFNILPSGAKTIILGSALPAITSVVIIDGTTQPGFGGGPLFAPVIEINAAAGGGNALSLQFGSSGSTVKGLCINRTVGRAIRLLGTSNNVIAGNFLGTDLSGTAAGPGNEVGVYIGGSTVAADNNLVGGTAAADRNIISGNTVDGIQINGGSGGATGNMLENNYIGVDVNGAILGNGSQGVAVFTTSSNTNNVIGGTAANAGNVISGNGNDGILIADAGTTGTRVEGNRIGTNPAGTASIPNGRGIEIANASSVSTIGGAASAAANVISGNTYHGILINGSNNNSVQRNVIGLNAAGNGKVPNGEQGIELSGGASSNTIGGSGTGNVISGNGKNGVNILHGTTSGNSILDNIIGLDVSGDAILSNANFGIAIALGANGNIVGGAGVGNVISGNDQGGVRIVDVGTNNNLVRSNIIGLNAVGTLPRPNVADGVILDTAGVATGNVIGGVGLGNTISGNGSLGIRILNGMTGTLVVDNIIGRDAANTASVPNGAGGVRIENSSGNTIGGTGANDGNIIGGNNGGDGVAVVGTATGNAILGNSIFSNNGLGIDLGDDGVTGNDVGDLDAGANNLQNTAVLSAVATDNATKVHVAGSLNAVAGVATYRVEFFAHDSPDPSGFGEAFRYLDFANVMTDAAGNATIAVSLSVLVTATTDYVTATVTDASNNTSEFAANVTAVSDLVVTTTADIVDGTTTSVSALIGAPGADNRISLREAIDAANATGGTDTIRFGIPLTDANHFYYKDDSTPSSLSSVVATTLADADITDFDPDYPAGFARSWYRIQPSVSALPTISDPAVVDGEAQPGFIVGAPVIALDGGSMPAGVDGLNVTSGSSTIRGLVIGDFTRNGLRLSGPGGYMVTGNYIGTDPSGTMVDANDAAGIHFRQLTGAASTVGGSTLAARNIISGNVGDGIVLYAFTAPGISSQVRIQGNYIGTDVTGTVGIGVQDQGIYAEFTGGHLIGGSGVGEGNVISGHVGSAINLNGNNGGAGTGADNYVIENNRIGTNATGNAIIGNGGRGLLMYGISSAASSASGNIIRGNVIAASAGPEGLLFNGNADNNLIDANFIGTDAGGTLDLGNTGHGIRVTESGGFLPTGNTIQSNVIRFNGLDGVRVEGTGSEVTVTQNQIWSNDGLGINLGVDAVTNNDLNDSDSGPNGLLNWPFIYYVSEFGGNLNVNFALDVPPGNYRIEFFKNPAGADPSGNGEGQVFVSSRNLIHPGGGSRNYSHGFPGAVGEVVTATATFCTDGATCAAFGATSELGRAFTHGVTAVELTSFEAIARDGGVDLVWKTGSELNNLGFHLYRSVAADGPYQRITEAVIPGLGSSPTGTSYRFVDGGLINGSRYFYKLEDIETTGRSKLHGPVSAVPDEGTSSEKDEEETEASDTEPRVAYGDPYDISARVVQRGPNGALIELVTGGFFATPVGEGAYRLEVPGFEESFSSNLPSLPMKRLWLDAVAGRKVHIASVRAPELSSFAGLRPAAASSPDILARREGTVRARSRRSRRAWRGGGVVPLSSARLVETGFQQDTKKALIELAPLRWDGDSGRLLWTRRLLVRVSFAGVERSERDSNGARGRRYRPRISHRERTVLAHLSTSRAGLYAVRFEDLFPARRRRTPALNALRLSRLGEETPYHVEPRADRFEPGSVLYFYSPGAKANPYGNEAVFELEAGTPGRTMAVVDASPSGTPMSTYLHRHEWEEDRYYQAGLIEAPSRWLWDVVLSPEAKHFPFAVGDISDGEAKLEVFLQGGSDFEAPKDHHVRVLLNGSEVAAQSWDGKAAITVEAVVPPGVLRPGQNQLTIHNLGDTEATYSMVYLDRFALTTRRETVAEEGRLKGRFQDSGTATIKGLDASSLALELSDEPRWLRGLARNSDGISLRVEAGRSYFAVASAGVLQPEIRRPSSSALRSTSNQADYLIIAPREFLASAAPLLERRRSQNLVSQAVAVEDIYDAFGYGEARPEALKEFLEYVYHRWETPSVRYVVLLGDATYDGKDLLGTGVVNRVPALMKKTSYLWTASDPSYASVNGEDSLPDIALGRLPAASLEEARGLIEKVLAYEDSGQSLSGPVVMVADNPDAAGDFESDSNAIASMLSDREVSKVQLSTLGPAGSRDAIVESFDRGASLLSYTGHGGIALWASENILTNSDVETLSPQPQQPIVMTMNCLNGYFHFPYFDALAESLVKAEGKGAIAAFSPSGLSLNGPAHVYHQALMTELTSGHHARLGDAVLEAQRIYAESGFFPELLAIYHLFGDPALELR